MSWWRRVAAVPAAAALMLGLAVPAAAAQGRGLQPHTLVVQVLPAMAGVGFTLDGRSFTSDARGLASITVEGVATRRLTVGVPRSRPGQRYRFQRWVGASGGDDYSTSRTVRMGGSVTRLVAGFDVESLVRWRFVDGNDQSVPERLVQEVLLKEDTGGRYRKPAAGYHWLTAGQVVRENSGAISVRPLGWSVEGVMVDGANAVFRSQQRFRATPRATWTIRLRFYEMQVSARDALFGVPAGSGVRLRSPDGRVRRLDLDERSRGRTGRLASGDYQLKPEGRGIAWWTPVNLSRSQEVQLKLLTWLDLGLVALAAMLVLVGLPLLGRLLDRQRRRAATNAAVGGNRDQLGQAKP